MDELLELRDEMQMRTSALSEAAMADVRAALAKHNVTNVEFSRPRADLEQLFLRTVRESGERPGRRFSTDEVAASGKAGRS